MVVFECPNLLEFLGEWGVGFEKGILYDDTNGAYFPSKGNTTLFLNSTYSEYTQTVDSSYPYYIATNIFPLIQEYETYDTRKSEIILTSPKTATIAPFDLKDLMMTRVIRRINAPVTSFLDEPERNKASS